MIVANIETFPLHAPFKPDTLAAGSAWGDKGLPVADSGLGREGARYAIEEMTERRILVLNLGRM